MLSQAKGLPSNKFKKHLKPYWNPELNVLAKENKKAWKEWVAYDRPRGLHPAYVSYKECKKRFSNAKKESEFQFELESMKEISKNQELNQRYFWYLVNKKKRKPSSASPLKLENEKTVTKCEEIREAWHEYFKKLFTPSKSDDYDEIFKKRVESRLQKMIEESYGTNENLLHDVTAEELNKIIKVLKCKKYQRNDGFTNEHVKYGGALMLKCLAKLFSWIEKYEYIPEAFKVGIIIPIPKGEKNRTKQDNYRGITWLPVIAKLFEKLIMSRIEGSVLNNCLIHEMQGAAQPHCSSLHSAWLVREAIGSNIENGKNVFIGLLDTKKAFDTVWQDGLFYKLYENGITGKTWRIIRKLFKNFKCHVRVGSELSDPFNADQGIHQGAPCSMFFYEMFENDLLIKLNESIASAKCGNVNVGGIAYADDIAVVSLSKERA